jgi:hypothetical protein
VAGVSHFEFLVEELSMEAFLRALLPRVLPAGVEFDVHPFQGKPDLLGKLESRLRAYSRWLPSDWRIVVLVDRDDDDCSALRRQLDDAARNAGLSVRGAAAPWQLASRIAIEELEAWYFGDWDAVRAAFPRVSATVSRRAQFRDPDAIAGGTWEAFERILQRHGYFTAGIAKIEAARSIAPHVDVSRSRSCSFRALHRVLIEAAR